MKQKQILTSSKQNSFTGKYEVQECLSQHFLVTCGQLCEQQSFSAQQHVYYLFAAY